MAAAPLADSVSTLASPHIAATARWLCVHSVLKAVGCHNRPCTAPLGRARQERACAGAARCDGARPPVVLAPSCLAPRPPCVPHVPQVREIDPATFEDLTQNSEVPVLVRCRGCTPRSMRRLRALDPGAPGRPCLPATGAESVACAKGICSAGRSPALFPTRCVSPAALTRSRCPLLGPTPRRPAGGLLHSVVRPLQGHRGE